MFGESLRSAAALLWSFDPRLWEIVGLSLQVSISAVVLASLIALPLGAATALLRFPGRRLLSVCLTAFMGLPPVVVGLVVYLLLSRSGPLGTLGLLFTPTAMILAQTLLIIPIVAALTRQVIADLWSEYSEQLLSLGSSRMRAIPTLLWDGRFSLLTAILAGFGRASAEVGAVMIVGGNIDHLTRVMTTAIALETSKGDLPLALGLGLLLIILSLTVNAGAHLLGEWAKQHSEAPPLRAGLRDEP
jgi:tungstate transport system permease protein|tara:strand:+ start:305 stop:1039 length:735 start_codon:yes stop_codon:yes gene_type:complete